MAKTVQISAEFVGLSSSLEKQIAASMAKMRGSFKLPVDSRALTDFSAQLDRATQRVVTLGTAFSVLATANRAIRELVTSTVQVEKSLTSVNTIFRLTNDNLNKFSGVLFDLSRETATSFDDVAKAATEFARQGLSVVETQKAVRAALLLSRDANIDVEESVKAVTSATNSFNKEALSRLQIVNRLASVDAAFAVSSKDLAEALVRTGSAAADAGVSFNQFIALVTAAQQVSQRGGTVIAGALNTIFTRINRKDTLEALDSLGIAITDVRGQALPTITVLQNFATAYDKMTGSIKNQTAELVGGVRQLNTLKATLQDLASGDNSVFSQVQAVIARSSNELERRNAARNQTLAALGSQAGTTAQQIGSNIGNVGIAGAAKPILSAVINNPLVQAFSDANGSAESAGGQAAETFLKGFGSALVFGVAPIVLRVLASVGQQVFSNIARDVAAITGLSSEEQKRAAIEREIVAIYQAGGVALQEQLALMTNLTERAVYMKTLLGGVGAGPGTSASTLAGAVLAQGYSPRRRAAEGYIPYGAESSAIAAGVGGAPANARPVYLGGFRRPDGRGIVANSSEFIVPGAAGGYPAIYNRDMIQKHGLPPGATPVAAGGYVPHAAGGLDPRYGQASYYQNLGFGGPPPPPAPPPLPTSSVSAEQFAKDFERAQKELAQTAKEQARAAKQKLADMEQILRDSVDEKQTSRGASLTSKKALAVAEQRVKDYQAQAALAREELTSEFAFAKAQKASVDRAVANLGPKRFTNGDNAIIPGGLGDDETPAEAAQRVKATRYVKLITQRKIGVLTPEQVEAEIAAGRDLGYDPIGRGRGTAGGNVPPLLSATSRSTSFYSRASKRVGSLGGTLALGLGLPFAGGLIDEGVGGTESGQRRGAAKGALSLAGTGATIGSFFGPEGVLPGVAIGAAIGGLTGWISKATKSFEELSAEIDLGTKKMSEEAQRASEVFRVEEDLKNAISSDNQEQVIALKKQRAIALSKTTNAEYLGIINQNVGNPERGSVEIAKASNRNMGARLLSTDLTRSIARDRVGKGQALGSVAGFILGGGSIGAGIGGDFGKLFDDDPMSKESQEAGKSAMMAVLANLPPADLQQLRALAKKDLPAALRTVGQMAGLSQEESASIANSARGKSSTQSLAGVSLFGAINDSLLREKGDPDAIEKVLGRQKGLIQLAGRYRTQSSFSTISSEADRSIQAAQNQVDLSSPLLTDIGRIQLQGKQGAASIAAQFSSQRDAKISGSQADLIKLANAAGGNDAFIKRIQGISSLSDVEAFSKDLSTNAGRNRSGLTNSSLGAETSAFREALETLSDTLRESIFAQQENTRANNENTHTLTLQSMYEKSSLSGAYKQSSGALGAATDTYNSSLQRNDSAATLSANSYAVKAAQIELYRRIGVRTEGQAGAEQLGLNLNQSYDQRLASFQSSQQLGSPTRVGQGIKDADLSLHENMQAVSDALSVAVRRGDEESSINNLRTQLNDLKLENQLRNSDRSSEGDTRLQRLQYRAYTARTSQFTNGSDISSTEFDIAKEQGLQGNAKGSLFGGFVSGFSGAKRDIKQFAEVGQQVAESLKNNFAGAFGDFVTGAKKAKDAFRDFIVGVLQESARAFATKAVVSLLGMLLGSYGANSSTPTVSAPGGGSQFLANATVFPGPSGSTGGLLARAAGGSIPTMLTGGEFVYPPAQASRIGGRMLSGINRGTMRGFAPGGLVRGGSGVADDVYQPLAAGSFVVRKAMVERYGANNLASLSIGGMPDDSSAMTSLHLASGGPVSSMMTAPSPVTGMVSSGGGGAFNIGVTINDNSTTTQSSTDQGGGSPLADKNFGATLARRIKETTLQVLQEQQRIGGILRPQSQSSF